MLLRLWLFFCENRTGRMEDTEENRAIIAGALAIPEDQETSRHAGKILDCMIHAAVIEKRDGLLVLRDYEEFQRDNATKGAHGRAASISMASAKKNAEMLMTSFRTTGRTSQHDEADCRRAFLVLMAINSALGRKPMSHGEYTDAIVSDVLEHIPKTTSDDEIKKVCAWIRRYAALDKRLKQPLSASIVQYWREIYKSAMADEGPLG